MSKAIRVSVLLISVMSVIIGAGMHVQAATGADLVAYGKYVYVDGRKGAEAFIDGKTEVIYYTGKGFLMPDCGNGHAHYSMCYATGSAGTIVSREDDVNKFLTETVPPPSRRQGTQRTCEYSCSGQLDKAGDMHFVLGTAYELDSWMDVDAVIANIKESPTS